MDPLGACDNSSFPTVELHRHLEGSIRLETLIEIAKASSSVHNIPKGNESSYWKSIFHIEQPCSNLTEMLDRFWAVQNCISSESIIERITYEMIEDCYREGTRVLEIRYSPKFIQHNHANLSFEGIHGAVMQGLHKAKSKYDMAVGLVGIIDRNLSLDESTTVSNFILQHKSDFVGMDLANDELKFDSKPFATHFQQAKRAGLHVTVHAGESLTDKIFATKVKEAIDLLGAERIGHGVGIITDPSVIDYVKQKGIVLEVCPTSNYLVGVVPSVKSHPIRKLKDLGVKIAVSTDDPGIFNLSLPQELQILKEELKFTTDELQDCNHTALQASFIPQQDKGKYFKQKLDIFD